VKATRFDPADRLIIVRAMIWGLRECSRGRANGDATTTPLPDQLGARVVRWPSRSATRVC
jgi:hypothetical protein